MRLLFCVCERVCVCVLRVFARSSKGSSSAHGPNKDVRMRQLKEDIGTSMVRINARPNMAPIITVLMNKFMVVGQAIAEAPKTVATAMMNSCSFDVLSSLVDDVVGNANVKTRLISMSETLYKAENDEMFELETQIKTVKKLMAYTTEAMLVAEFGDQGGNIQWVNFSAGAKEVLKQKAEDNVRENARAGLGV